MHPRKPLTHEDQIVRLRKLSNRAERALRHCYEEFFVATGRRRDCPLEVAILSRQLDQTREIVALARVCTEEIRRQEAMFYAPFKPGDRIIAEQPIGRSVQTFGPYLIVDVQPDKRTVYRYEVAGLVKSGRMHKRGAWTWIAPRRTTVIRLWAGEVGDEAESEARYFRECAATSRTLAFENGDLSLFEAVSAGHLGGVSYRRKDRTDVQP
jgi:hypothetical protein